MSGHGTQSPDIPVAIWDEILLHERAFFSELAEEVGMPVEAWPYLMEFMPLLVALARTRRIRREQDMGASMEQAAAIAAEAYGKSKGSVKRAHERFLERVYEARKRYREECDSSVADKAPRSA